jgi:DNA-binding MarR family transcriptional regulator
METRKKKNGSKALPRTRDAARQARMLEVLGEFRIIIRTIRSHYRQVERSSGISGAQLWALAHISDHPDCTVSELAKALAVHVSTASNLVGRLEALALVKRTRMKCDQRVVRLRLTASGSHVISRAPRPLIGVLQQALSNLSGERLASLHGDLAVLIGLMQGADTRAARAIPLSEL